MIRLKSILTIIFFISLQNIFAQISEKKRAIIEAVKIGTFEEVKEKIQTTDDANVKDAKKISVLMWAIYLKDLKTVKYLIEKGAEVNEKAGLYVDAISYYGNNLGIASAENKLDILKYLIETCKIPVDDREFNPDDNADSGWTAVEWACSRNNFEVLKYLVSKKAKVSIDDELPLKLAIEKRNIEMVKFLLDNGAKPNTAINSPLYYATFYQNFEIVKLLIDRGADANSKVNQNQSVFNFALENGYLDIAKYLVGQDAETNTAFEDTSYPIHICAKNGYFAILKQLVKNGADVNLTTQNLSLTPLMYASSNNQLEIAKFLIEQGADKNMKSTEGQTALDFAKIRKDLDGKPIMVETIKYLEEGVFTPLDKWKQLNQQIVMYINSQQYLKASEVAEEAVEFVIKKYKKGSKEHGQALLNLGRLQVKAGMRSKSIEVYQECLDVYKKHLKKESLEFQNIYYGLADAYYKNAQYQKVIDMYKPFPKHSKSNTKVKIQALRLLASSFYYSGQYLESSAICQEILENKSDNIHDQTFVYGFWGNIYEKLGKYTEADKNYKKAFEIYNQLSKENSKDYSGIAHLRVLANMTNLLYIMGKFQTAEFQYNFILQKLEEMKQSRSIDYANVLSSLASMYIDLGRYDESLTNFKRAIKLKEELLGKSHISYATTLSNMTDLFVLTRQYKRSEEFYQKVLAIEAKTLGKTHQKYGITLNNLGQLYSRIGKFEEAQKCYEEALELQKKSKTVNELTKAIFLRNLAYIYTYREQNEKALELFQQCYEIRKKTLDSTHIDYASILQSIAVAHLRLKNYEEAEKYYLQANRIFQNIKQSLYLYMSENDRLSFDKQTAYYSYNFKAFAINRIQENPQIVIDLFENELNSKASILETSSAIKRNIYISGDSSLIKYYERWQKYREILGKTSRMTKTGIDQEQINLEQIKEQTNQLEKNMSLYIKKPSIYHLEDLQKKLKPKEAIIEIIQVGYDDENKTKNTAYVALILKKKQKLPEFVLIDSTGQLDGKFFKYYQNAIKFKRKDKYSYEKYWSKIAKKLEGIEKVYVSSAGIYNKISFYSLRNPKTENYLIDEIEVQIVTSSRDILKEEKPIPTQNQDMIFFGYPIYDLEEKEHLESIRNFRRGVESTVIENVSTQNTSKRALQKAKYNQKVNLSLLPGTKKEVEKIYDLLTNRGFKAKKYIGKNALEESIKSVRSPKILHIATHGFFLSDVQKATSKERIFGIQSSTLKENPLLRSGLLLTGSERHLNEAEAGFELEDGILTAYEASNLQLLGTELVVLSACETGLGTVQNGEGVYGLQRAFLIAGAKAVMMSLWQVDDNATQRLMELFYQKWAETDDKRASFIWAKKELRKEFPEPYYWSAFVMIGA